MQAQSALRLFLLILGWSSVVGSFGDGALGLYALWLTLCDNGSLLAISVDDFLYNYVPMIYWVKQVAFYLMPEAVVHWLFGLPALIYFPTRIVMSLVIGWWALAKAAQLKQANTPS